MLSWKEYDVKCEQYADMRRDVIKWEQVREAQAQRRRRMPVLAWVARRLGRSMTAWGARLEARYGNS
jgi:hypothetical protein